MNPATGRASTTASRSISTQTPWIGLEALDRDYVTIRASIKTGPLLQFRLHRELNDRVYRAFTKAGIGFGAPPVA